MCAGMDKGKNSPEENKHAGRDNNFFRQQESKPVAEFQESQVKKNVVPLPGEIQPGRLALCDKLRKPRVVSVAGQVARFDMAVPETWQSHRSGNSNDAQPKNFKKRKRD